MRFIYAQPKPRPSIEIHLGRTPRWTALVVVLAVMAMLIGVVALYVEYTPDALRIDVPKPNVQNVSAKIQQHVDDVVEKVVRK